MPCYDSRPSDELTRANRKIDELTAMLCAVLRDMEEHRGLTPDPTTPVGRWWTRHKLADAVRKDRGED